MSLAARLSWLRAHRSHPQTRAALVTLAQRVLDAGHGLEAAETLVVRLVSERPGADDDGAILTWVRRDVPAVASSEVAEVLSRLPRASPPGGLGHARRMASVRRVHRALTEELVAA